MHPVLEPRGKTTSFGPTVDGILVGQKMIELLAVLDCKKRYLTGKDLFFETANIMVNMTLSLRGTGSVMDHGDDDGMLTDDDEVEFPSGLKSSPGADVLTGI
jgi:hypothetical protein